MTALDVDNSKIWWGKNGTWFASGDPVAGTNAGFTNVTGGTLFPSTGDGSTAGTFNNTLNFGQRPFAYTPPTGFKKINTYNLPDSTIKDGSRYMNPVLYTGTGATQSISNVGFSPDLIWVKRRDTSTSNLVLDSVRPITNLLVTDTTSA